MYMYIFQLHCKQNIPELTVITILHNITVLYVLQINYGSRINIKLCHVHRLHTTADTNST